MEEEEAVEEDEMTNSPVSRKWRPLKPPTAYMADWDTPTLQEATPTLQRGVVNGGPVVQLWLAGL